MIITAITEKSKNRSALSLDGAIRIWLDNDLIYEKGLKIGDSISEEAFLELKDSNDFLKAKNSALNILSYRDHSKAELRKKLKAKSIDDDTLDETIERLSEVGLIDDQKFAEMFYRELITIRRYSKNRARFELLKKGLDKETVELTMEDFEVCDSDTIFELLGSKYNGKMCDEESRKKLSQTLMRNGFSWSDIKTAFRRYEEEENESF